jgi:hypothetical protein
MRRDLLVVLLHLPTLEFVQVCGIVKSTVAFEVEAEEEQCCLPWS